jgi:hypothetical protein
LDRLAQKKEVLARAEQELRARGEREFAELESALRAAVAQKGWKLDGTWPTLYVERGVTIEIDDKARTVKVAGRPVPTASAKDVIVALAQPVAALVPKTFSSKAFLDQLAKAYDEIKGSSTQVPVMVLYRTMVIGQQGAAFWRDARRDRFHELSVDQFRARLTRSLEPGHTSTSDGREIRTLPPLDPKDAIFVYQPAELRFAFVGRIEFSRL